MELLLFIITATGPEWPGCVCLGGCISECLSERTSCTMTLTKGNRVPFYYIELVLFKPVRK